MDAMRPQALYVMDVDVLRTVYGPEEQRCIASLVDVVAPPQTAESALALPHDVLSSVRILISGWGGPRLDSSWLERCPHLEAVFYGAGSVAGLMTPEAWRRGIVVTSASEANAVPVAEYTLAMIVLSLKRAWRLAAEIRSLHSLPSRDDIPGCFERVVGLVSLGAVGRAVVRRLKALD